MRVISNTSPLIGLAKINRLDILQQLFENIVIPQAVYNEFLKYCPYTEAHSFQSACNSFITVLTVDNRMIFKRNLDLGESEVLTLALSEPADIVLIDDRKAFNEAKELNIKTASTHVILKMAETKGFIENYQVLVAQLAERGFFISKY
jgi:predicted nucleic acid-binding protein